MSEVKVGALHQAHRLHPPTEHTIKELPGREVDHRPHQWLHLHLIDAKAEQEFGATDGRGERGGRGLGADKRGWVGIEGQHDGSGCKS